MSIKLAQESSLRSHFSELMRLPRHFCASFWQNSEAAYPMGCTRKRRPMGWVPISDGRLWYWGMEKVICVSLGSPTLLVFYGVAFPLH